MVTKDFVDYSPDSDSNNGSIDITAPRNPQMKPSSTAIAVKGIAYCTMSDSSIVEK